MRNTRARDATWLILVFGLLEMAVSAWRIRHVYFYQDDFLNFAFYVERGLSLKNYVFYTVFGQIVPGYRLAQAGMFKLFDGSFLPEALVIVSLTGAATATAISIMLRVGVEKWLACVAGLFMVFSYQKLDAQYWWSSSLHTLPGLFAGLLTVRLLLDERSWLATVVLAIGLSFYSKTLFAPIVAFGLLLAMPDERNLFAKIRHAIVVVLPIAALGLLWLIAFYFAQPPLGLERSTLANIVRFLWDAFADATLAMSLGLGNHGSDFGDYTLLPGLIVLAMLVATSFYLNSWRAMIAWGTFVVYFLMSMLPIALTRAAVYPDAGLWPRYSVESVVYLAVLAAASFANVAEKSKSQWVSRLIMVLGCILALVLQIKYHHVKDQGDYAAIRNYVANLRYSLAELPREAIIADTVLPQFVLLEHIPGYNTTRTFVPIFSSQTVGSPATHVVGTDGRIQRLADDGPSKSRSN